MIADYAGATGRIDLAAVSKLGPRYVCQQKHDGCYVQLRTDSKGRVVNVLSRTGEPLREASDMIGIRWIPNAVIAAELDAHTEAGNRIAATRGYRLAHVFDAIRIEGRYLAREPYHVRRDELHRAIALVELQQGNGWDHSTDADGRAHDGRGRYVRPVPRSWRRFPLVEQLPVREAHKLYEEATVSGDVEGAVIVALDAKLGARGSKRKLKPVHTLDAVVLSVSRRSATCAWAGHTFVVGVGDRDVKPGQMIEVTADGFYERAPVPRFVRLRSDLYRSPA